MNRHHVCIWMTAFSSYSSSTWEIGDSSSQPKRSVQHEAQYPFARTISSSSHPGQWLYSWNISSQHGTQYPFWLSLTSVSPHLIHWLSSAHFSQQYSDDILYKGEFRLGWTYEIRFKVVVLHQVWTHSESILIPYPKLNDVHESTSSSKSSSKITFHRSHKRS